MLEPEAGFEAGAGVDALLSPDGFDSVDAGLASEEAEDSDAGLSALLALEEDFEE